MLNVRYLNAFRAVARAGSVSGAARALHVSQPAVTKSLRLLEDTLDVQLFRRINGRLFITPEAEALLPEVERLFGVLAGIEGRADELRDGSYGTVTIASVTTLATSIVSLAIERFRTRNPNVSFDVQALPTKLAVQYVATNYVDLGILDAPLDASEMETLALCRSDMGCLMPQAHPLASRDIIEPADLQHIPLIAFREDTFSGLHLRHAFHAAGIPHPIQFSVNNSELAYSLVSKGMGIAYVDSFPLLSDRYPELTIRPLKPSVTTYPSVIFSRTRPVPIAARLFVDELIATIIGMMADERCLLRPPLEQG